MDQLFYTYWTAMLVASCLALGACSSAPRVVAEVPVERAEPQVCPTPDPTPAPQVEAPRELDPLEMPPTSFEEFEARQEVELQCLMRWMPDSTAPQSEWSAWAWRCLP